LRRRSAGKLLHLVEHLFDIGEAERLFARSLVLFERVKLPDCDGVALGGVLFGEERVSLTKPRATPGGKVFGTFKLRLPAAKWQAFYQLTCGAFPSRPVNPRYGMFRRIAESLYDKKYAI